MNTDEGLTMILSDDDIEAMLNLHSRADNLASDGSRAKPGANQLYGF